MCYYGKVDMRSSKRFIILGITVLFLGVGIAAGTFAISRIFPADPEPQEFCGDKICNAEEDYLSCPSDCEEIIVDPSDTLESLEVIDVYYFNKPAGKIDIAILLKNPNPDHGADEFNYTLTIKAGDTTVKEIKGSSYILPQEQKYIVLLNQEPGGNFTDIEMNISSSSWTRLNEFFSLNLEVFDIKLERLPEENAFYARLAAFVRNNSIFGLTDIKVVGVLLDSSGEPLAVSRTSIQTVLEGEMREVEMFWPNQISLGAVASTDVKAYSNVLKNDNFVREYGVDEAPTAPARREDDRRNYFQLPEVFDTFKGWNPF